MHKFPGDKRFAFSIFDDTDLSTVGNVYPVYRLLAELGIRTTKSVWPLASVNEGWHGGSSLQDAEYLRFVLALKEQGFEIALHNVRNHDSPRDLIASGLEKFRELIGHYPRTHANHSRNRDNIYWGASRFTSLGRLYRVGGLLRRKHIFEGEDPETSYFWGDLCQEKLDYVRNFVFRQINLDLVNPTLPYHDPRRPFVKYWFSSCEGADVNSFCDMTCESNQERLEAEGGVCIMYTHFACGFASAGKVDVRVRQRLQALSKRNGWFVPVSILLDHLRGEHNGCVIPTAELASMERQWVLDRVRARAKHVFQGYSTASSRFSEDNYVPAYRS
jgi:hypothetical protein